MTVTINTLGTNSRQIVIDNETSATNIIDAVNTCLTALGWSLIDTVTSGSRGLQTTKVYSAPNADGTTTKYMIIRYDLHRQYWFTSCCESWNTSTNVATNESWYGARQILLPLQYSNTVFYIFATSNYACFMGVVQNEPSAWQGVFEFERAAPEDIATKDIPCFGWTSSLTIGEPYGNFNTLVNTSALTTSSTSGFMPVGFAVPRTKNGLTGLNAFGVFTIITALGNFPPTYGQIGADWSAGGITQTLNSHNGMLGTWGTNSSYVWDNTDTPISNLKLNGYNNLYLLGRIYGLKITTALGAVLDTTTVPVDSSLFYVESGGANTTHYLLGIHGGYQDRLAVGANRLVNTVFTSGTDFGTTWQTVLVSGRYIYFATTTGFHKFDIQTQGYTLNILPTAQYFAVKFDGENSLYVSAAAANIIYKINLSNDTYTTLSMTGSWSALAIDDDNLFVCSTVATAATINVKRVSLSTFTETTNYNVACTTGTWISNLSTADYAGYLYIGLCSAAATNASRVTRLTIADSSTSFILVTSVLSASTASNANMPCITQFDGANLNFYQFCWGAGASINNCIRYERVLLSNFTMTEGNSVVTGGTDATALYMLGMRSSGTPGATNSPEKQGCWEPPSFAGLMILASRNTGGNTFRLPIADTKVGYTTAIPVNLVVLDSANTSIGQMCTDQCSLYAMSGTTKIVKYTNAQKNYNFNGVVSANILIAQ